MDGAIPEPQPRRRGCHGGDGACGTRPPIREDDLFSDSRSNRWSAGPWWTNRALSDGSQAKNTGAAASNAFASRVRLASRPLGQGNGHPARHTRGDGRGRSRARNEGGLGRGTAAGASSRRGLPGPPARREVSSSTWDQVSDPWPGRQVVHIAVRGVLASGEAGASPGGVRTVVLPSDVVATRRLSMR